MVFVIIAVLLLLAFLPRIAEAFGKSADKTQEEIVEEKEAEQKREEKGAACNTIDFIFGEGTCKDLGNFEKETEQEKIITNLNQSASDALDREVTFDPSTTVTKEGIIEADSPPTFELTDEDILAIQNKQQKQKRQTRFS